ncbi:BlaI/MecI/CopY family transcriptional regulator [Fimbriimonas ginsengisoli]|uniref:Methicillin resistance protein n=1 Tax=Fimbriimonas ginsengisoli Gsoil 348 TaxID=661478 RepID=A0A068NYF2_FIMGI|nr:BlaI/MecI/CopY family transcriptional regulator [Fimbriimonas ginsengisoli]AIE86929.1 methicillin resistance protein [Fimbriimonas ginsengisoli Gsoil 348]
MKKKPSIGRSESDVLRFIAESGGASVTEVGDYLAATKGQTRNTALNMMERLRQKGFVARKKVDGVYHYFPSQEKERLLQSFVEDFVDGVLGGSVAPLVAYLGSRTEVDERQFEELRKLVQALEKTRDDT